MNNKKRTKFSDVQISKLFKMLNDDNVIRRIPIAKDCGQLHPTSLKYFRNPASVKEALKPGKKFNAFVTVSAGHVYDTWGSSKAKTMQQRNDEAVAEIDKMIKRMNEIFQQSSDPLYSRLEAEVVNKDFHVVRTYNDSSDDGDDAYGVEAFISIHYKKDI